MVVFKKLFSVFLLMSFLSPSILTAAPPTEINKWDGTVAEGFASGTGKASDPYIIETASQLAYFTQTASLGETFKDKYIQLTRMINFNNGEWLPVKEFAGHFDGGGNSVYNWKISYIMGDVGFFGRISGGTVENLGVMNFKINVSGEISTLPVCAGGIAGAVEYGGTVSNCYAYGEVKAYSKLSDVHAGGVAGEVIKGNVNNSFSSGSVTATVYTESAKKYRTDAGGLIGYTKDAKVINCYTIASVTGKNSGRFIGWCDGSVSSCYYTGEKTSVNPYGYLFSVIGTGVTMISSNKAGYLSTFEGWNFENTWCIGFSESYDWPTLYGTPLMNHKLSEVNREKQSCTTDGHIDYKCSVCGDTFVEVIPATGHNYGEWTTVTEAAVGKDGLKKRVCSICGGEEHETIPMLTESTAQTTTETTVITTAPQETTTAGTQTIETTTTVSTETTTIDEKTPPSDGGTSVIRVFVVLIIVGTIILLTLGGVIAFIVIKRKK